MVGHPNYPSLGGGNMVELALFGVPLKYKIHFEEFVKNEQLYLLVLKLTTGEITFILENPSW